MCCIRDRLRPRHLLSQTLAPLTPERGLVVSLALEECQAAVSPGEEGWALGFSETDPGPSAQAGLVFRLVPRTVICWWTGFLPSSRTAKIRCAAFNVRVMRAVN